MVAQPEAEMQESTNLKEGKIRLSLTDVIYGLVLGYGFNIIANGDPTGVQPVLFALVMWVVVSDWSFVHLQYWKDEVKYTFWPFVIDLAILLVFAIMTRFALKDKNTYVLLLISVMFLLYALWDWAFGESLKGRAWKVDWLFDFVGALAFFGLWFVVDAPSLGYWYRIDIPHAPDIEIHGWIVAAFVLYALFGPHWIGEKIRSLVWR